MERKARDRKADGWSFDVNGVCVLIPLYSILARKLYRLGPVGSAPLALSNHHSNHNHHQHHHRRRRHRHHHSINNNTIVVVIVVAMIIIIIICNIISNMPALQTCLCCPHSRHV